MKHLKLIHIIGSALIAGGLMFFLWQELDPRFFMLLVLNLIICEFYLQVRWRFSVICPQCHFDPVLYLKSKVKAEQKVKQKLKKHKTSASYLFSQNSPYTRLPKIKVKKQSINFQDKSEDLPKVREENKESLENGLNSL